MHSMGDGCRRWVSLPAFAAVLAIALPAPAQPVAPAPAVIPLPAKVVAGSGEFAVDAKTMVRAARGDAAAREAAAYFVERMRESRGVAMGMAEAGEATTAAIHFAIDANAPAGDEAYLLDIAPSGIEVRARGAAGLFYGGVTLWQLLTADGGRGLPVRVRAQRIEDAPRFRWRGFMLDSARHMPSVEQIKRFLDQMAQAKLNVFHWHLTDDQGWRLEIKRYPRLTEVGAWRIPAGKAGRDADGRPVRYGGFYTQAQAREIVEYAARRHIGVVPEIEMPGHAQAAIASYPWLGVTGATPPVSAEWGVSPYIYNIDDATFHFLENVLDEVMAIFPGRYIHIGGDEAVKPHWRASSEVQARMRALGLKDETQLQSWFVKRIERFVASRGRKLIGWDEILEGGLPEAATVMSWRGMEGAVEAAREGHDVVLSPSNVTYLNRMQDDAADEPPSHDYPTPLRAVYGFEPVPAELTEAQAAHVLGAQANLWTEHVRTGSRMEHMAFPRLAALAEIAWSPRASRDWDGFLQRLAPQMQRYRSAGIAAADSAFAARIEAVDAGGGKAKVSLRNQSGLGELRYTVDGGEPAATSPPYRGTFELRMPATVRANAFHDGRALAAPRMLRVDDEALRTVDAERLQPCATGSAMRLEDDEPAGEARAVVPVDIGNPCWLWKDVDLSATRALRVEAVDLPFNFMFGGDPLPGTLRPPQAPEGELEILRGGCDGPRIGVAPLAGARRERGIAVLDAPLQAAVGTHDLCLRFTRDRHDPLWAIDRVQRLPVHP